MEPLLSRDFYARLHEKTAEWALRYQRNEPFPSLVIDDFLPSSVLEAVLEDFPEPQSEMWHAFKNKSEIKLGSTKDSLLPTSARRIIQELNSGAFLEFLEALSGIPNLISDSKLAGGGLHQILPGGKLAIHADFNKHPSNLLDRRLNLLIYLNKNWKEEFGGHFEMWDSEMTQCRQKILPVFNRFVLFSTTSTSYHGHPDPLTCPPDRTRKSLALYYYSNGRPEAEIAEKNHSTLFRERPGEDLGFGAEREALEKKRQDEEKRAAEEATRLLALAREAELERLRQNSLTTWTGQKRAIKLSIREVTPPILLRGVKKFFAFYSHK